MAESNKHEITDVKTSPIVVFMIAMFALIIFSMIFCAVYFRVLEKIGDRLTTNPHNMFQEQKPPSGPLLEVHVSNGLNAVRVEQKKIINGYGWVDTGNSIAHIPVEDAKKLILQRKDLKSR